MSEITRREWVEGKKNRGRVAGKKDGEKNR